MILLQVPGSVVQAVDTSIKVATSTPPPSAAELSILQLIMKGGVMIYPIAILAVVSIYIILERFFFIRKMTKVNPWQITNIKNLITDGKIDQAMMLCKSDERSISKLFEIGLKRIGQPIKDIERFIETANLIEVTRMSKKLGYLGIIAGIAPMFGFIGTIIGIIKIFYTISLENNISIGAISGGLYEKMISSCAGLSIGVIAYAGYHLLNMMIDKFISRAEIEMFSFINLLQEPVNEAEKK